MEQEGITNRTVRNEAVTYSHRKCMQHVLEFSDNQTLLQPHTAIALMCSI